MTINVLRSKIANQKSKILLLLLLPLISGCTIASVLAYKFTPPPRTPARFVLPAEPAVVLIENYRDSAQNEIDAQQLASFVLADLRKHQSVPLVDDLAVQQLRDRDKTAFGKMAIPAIGRAVGAKQVIYVDLLRHSVDGDAGGQMIKGTLDVRVKVVDSATGQTRWPGEIEQGWPLVIETPWLQLGDKTNETSIRQQMAAQMGVQIGRLFRSWVNEDEAAELQ